MIAALQTIRDTHTLQNALPHFVKGIGIFLALYALIWGIVILKADDTYQAMNDRLASETLTVEMPVQETLQTPTATSEALESFKQSVLSDTSKALPAAPIADLSEKTADGAILPKRSNDGITPFFAYKRPFATLSNKPKIALVMADYGLSQTASLQALQTLPPDISFLISPYVTGAQDWVTYARQAGHELWLHMPFETQNYPAIDTGPLTLLRRSSLRLNEDKALSVLSNITGYAGIYGTIDSTFLQAETVLNTIMETIFARGLAYLELQKSADNDGLELLATQSGMAIIENDLILSSEQNNQTAELQALKDQADLAGGAIAVFAPTPNMLKALPDIITALENDGYVIAPVSAFSNEYKKP